MTSPDVERIYSSLACEQIDLAPDGDRKFIVYTPFTFDDGDHYVIVLNESGAGWTLTDEGNTLMHLSYEGFELTPERAVLIDGILRAANARNCGGELRLNVISGQFGVALFGFAQMLIRIIEAAKWMRAAEQQLPLTVEPVSGK